VNAMADQSTGPEAVEVGGSLPSCASVNSVPDSVAVASCVAVTAFCADVNVTL